MGQMEDEQQRAWVIKGRHVERGDPLGGGIHGKGCQLNNPIEDLQVENGVLLRRGDLHQPEVAIMDL